MIDIKTLKEHEKYANSSGIVLELTHAVNKSTAIQLVQKLVETYGEVEVLNMVYGRHPSPSASAKKYLVSVDGQGAPHYVHRSYAFALDEAKRLVTLAKGNATVRVLEQVGIVSKQQPAPVITVTGECNE